LLGGCLKNDPPGSPTGLTVKAGESSAVITWAVDPAVEYWLFYAPKSVAPSTTDMSKGWTDLAGGSVVIRVQSPATVINLTNDTEYVFTVNGRVNGGPGGKGRPSPMQRQERLAANGRRASQVPRNCGRRPMVASMLQRACAAHSSPALTGSSTSR
jgi:hypothetical protein